MPDGRTLGRIVRLQVQRSSLKVDDAVGVRRYEPAPILVVPAVRVTPTGLVGLPPDGAPIVDVHNEIHPFSKNSGGRNDVSLGFTSHYRAMREQFGAHLADGIAGENVLIESEDRVVLDELVGDVLVVGEDGRRVELTGARVAEPCEPFTRWALAEPVAVTDPRIPEGLRFLRQGMRGFYLRYEGQPTEIRLGDAVWALSAGQSPARSG